MSSDVSGICRTLIAAGCSVNQLNMYEQTPIEVAANAGHQQIVLELMHQPQSMLQTNTLSFKGNDKCKSYQQSFFQDIITTGHCKLSDFGMSQYSTGGWHGNYYSGKVRCDIE